MCGIAGAVFSEGRTTPQAAGRLVQDMIDALAHRGPDGSGVWTSGAPGSGAVVALGHRRLAIIDVTADGAQPMTDAALAITYNGEAYNFRDLGRELNQRGPTLRTRSDTEVVLRAYAEWGPSCVDRLRGMFAFGIWDGPRRRLFLARDRFGIKPLYYYAGDGVFLFASEIRALLASGLVPRRVDSTALWQYLGYQSVPSPRTLVEEVRMLEPGHFLDVPAGGRIVPKRYWDLLDVRPSPSVTVAESRTEVRRLLDDAVSAHMVSDVPVGVFLSGGIDSSALAMLVAQQGTRPITFSVGTGEAAFDETEQARAVATACGAEHHEVRLSDSNLLGLLPAALGAMDHPSGDGVNTYVVSHAVHQAGLKVALSGLGGDELFGGYPSFGRIRSARGLLGQWGRTPAVLRRTAARVVGALDGVSAGATKVAAVCETDGALQHVWPITRQVFSDAERRRLLSADAVMAASLEHPYSRLLAEAFARQPAAGLVSRISYAEARTYMHDTLLADTDQMSMAHGLEIRVPLLDHRLAEYVVGLSDTCKDSREGRPKRLLVESLDGLLPAAVVNGPKKGFVLPFPIWMRGALRGFCEAGIADLERRQSFRPAALQSTWSAFVAGDRRVTWTRVWQLVVLGVWLEQNGIAA
jgi:asparagine synthase (glutamine-hydrolysing)